MADKNLVFEKKGRIGIITINRPEVLNALNKQTLHNIEQLLDEICKDYDVKIVIITGRGKAFIAGGDIAEMSMMTPSEARKYVQLGQRVLNKIENLRIPVIAAINGFALGGGCELALACDFRWSSNSALFGQPEVGLGIIPGFAGTQRLTRLCGVATAKELILSGKHINSAEALKMGLVTKVFPEKIFMQKVITFAEQIAMQSPYAVSLAKSAINKGIDLSLRDGMEYETECIIECFSHEQSKEGLNAFLEKRKPDWKNNG